MHGEVLDAVEEIGTERALFHQLREISVGGAEQGEIDRLGLAAAQGRHLAFLQDSQQAGLQVEWHVADLVEKQDAAVRLLHAPRSATPLSSGEGAIGVTEELGFDEGFGEGCAVDRDEGSFPALAEAVQATGEDLFADTGFSLDEYGDVGVQYSPGLLQHPAAVGIEVVTLLLSGNRGSDGCWNLQ